MADTGGKKKGKKQKGKAVSLNAFLSSQTPGGTSSVVYAAKSSNWADESEDLPSHGSPSWNDPYAQPQEVQRIVLPTAPRAARAGAVDLSQLPKGPPYTAFLGNLPYDVEEEDIYNFFQSVQVKDVRLPRETENGRLKGFGYAEFDDIDVFLRALTLDDQSLKGRRIRVDVAGQSQGADKEKDSRGRELASEADGDWRTGPKDPPSGRQDQRDLNGDEQRRGFGNNSGRDSPTGDRRGGYDGGRGGGYGSRGRSYGERDGYGNRGGGFGDRDGYGSRGGGFGDGDRGGYGDRDGYRNRRGGYGGRDGYDDGDRRGFGDRDGFGSRREYGNRDRGYGDRDRGYGDRDRGYGDRDRGYGDRDRGFGDRDRGFGDRDRGYGDRNRGYGDSKGYGDRDRGYGDRGRGFGDRDRGYGDRDRGYGDRDRGYGDRDRGYGDRDRGFGDRDRGFGDRDRGYGDRDRGFGDGDRGHDGRDRAPADQDRTFGDGDNRERRDKDRPGDRGADENEPTKETNSHDGDRRSEEEDRRRDGGREPSGRFRDGERNEERREPRERPRLQLKPRSTPKDDNDTSNVASSAIFGGAKPVNTAAREMEIAARLEKEKAKKESQESSDRKPADRRRVRSTGSDDGEKKFEKSPPSSVMRRQGERGEAEGGRGVPRADRGRGRGKSGGRGGKREPRPVEPKKYEEPEIKVWAAKSKYSALLETDDDEVDCRSDNEDEDEEKEEEETGKGKDGKGKEEEGKTEEGKEKVGNEEDRKQDEGKEDGGEQDEGKEEEENSVADTELDSEKAEVNS